MRILLTSTASYAPPRGGSTRSNLVWLRQLAASNHTCQVVCSTWNAEDHVSRSEGIEIRAFRDLARRSHRLAECIHAFEPDWVLVSSEDLSHSLLRQAEAAAAGRVVYIAHTPQFFPFGPESWNPDPRATQIAQGARAVVVIGEHMRGYVGRHAGVTAHVVHPPIYGDPAPVFDPNGFALMINPCAVKGLAIFLALSERFPEYRFAGLAGWGTTSEDRAAMASHANIEILDTVPDIGDALRRARVLLMPSLWYEGFGLIAMEALLRGLPVIASNSGGLEEAKRGTGYVVPVSPISRYEPSFDENHMPRAAIPPQHIEPWANALRTLMTGGDAWREESERSHRAAVAFTSGLRASALEELLLSLEPAHSNPLAYARGSVFTLAEPQPSGSGSPLRILLAHNSLYFPSHGGGDRSNRLLMEALAARGHAVRVVARIEKFGPDAHSRFLEDLSARSTPADTSDFAAVKLHLNGVEIHTLTQNPKLRDYFANQIATFDPDVILTSTDDPAQLLFEVAVRAERARVIHLVRATIAAPFGPDSSSPNTSRTGMLRRADSIAGVSEYVARYVREYGGMDAIHVPISLFEQSEIPNLGRFDSPYVTLTNPCAVKGIDILLALAGRMPDVAFAGVPTWGTNAHDLARLAERSNITVLAPQDNIDDILKQTRVLLVPSLWAEARSRIVVEAMARGIPVLGANIGGIPEAKLGVPYLLPVNPIQHYKDSLDEKMVPIAEVPPQDIGPWEQALRRVIADRVYYEELSGQSRDTALGYIRNTGVEPFERHLFEVVRRPRRTAAAPVAHAIVLSPEKRKLLALRLAQASKSKSPWFPMLRTAKPSELRLFCFPHAGAGIMAYREWQRHTAKLAISPILLPGRESRSAETPLDHINAVVAALEREIAPHLNAPFAFFGHSMGAGIAFELARALRRAGKRLPKVLIASAARAPQGRLNYTPGPEPSDEDLIEQLRRLDPQLATTPDVLSLVLPVVRSDTRLYRNYIYTSEPPLDIPIFAYGGESDPSLHQEHLEGWREQTTSHFELRLFPGGHFYIRSGVHAVIAAIIRDTGQ